MSPRRSGTVDAVRRPSAIGFGALAVALIASMAVTPSATHAGPPQSSNPTELTNVGGRLFFSADNGTSGRELWMSNGTAAGTKRVKDINPGSGGSNPHELTNVGGRAFFAADDGTSGIELWISDGTAPGTRRVKNIHP
jgi:ELWxxDGT repeat protein